MSPNPQNIYDNLTFFNAYSKLPRSQGGLAEAPEWPALQEMISTQQACLRDCRVLDLGCGYGWFARWAREQGAAYIRAIDLSDKMIARARELEVEERIPSSASIDFKVGDIQDLMIIGDRADHSFDLVYSSLTLHYVEDLPQLYRNINRTLKKGGTFVFSVEHPIFSAPVSPVADWKVIQDGDSETNVWPLNSYSEEGWRTSSWLGVEGIKKYHRTVETYVSHLINNGFVLKGLKDWVPSKEDVVRHPEWATERHRPYFLLISAQAQ